MLVLFIISRRVMKSSKEKSITDVLREARAALRPASTRQGLQMRTLSLGAALVLSLLAGTHVTLCPLQSCSVSLWDGPAPSPLVCDGAR